MNTINEKQFLLFLRIGVFCVFIGRAWQFIFWDAPYRALLWDQKIMEPFLKNLFGIEWGDWVTSMSVDAGIQLSIRITGIIFLLISLLVLIYSKERKWPSLFIGLGFCLLFVLAVLQTKEKFFHVGQFFEHASQMGSPLILIAFIQGWLNPKKMILAIKLMIALTFFCHGLYAINYYPRPGIFVDLMINSLGTSESFAHQFIWLAGIIDLILPFLLFIPKVSRPALWYAAVWGLITALSRVTSGFYIDFPLDSLHQVWHTTAYRLIHGLLPLALLAFEKPITLLRFNSLSKNTNLQEG